MKRNPWEEGRWMEKLSWIIFTCFSLATSHPNLHCLMPSIKIWGPVYVLALWPPFDFAQRRLDRERIMRVRSLFLWHPFWLSDLFPQSPQLIVVNGGASEVPFHFLLFCLSFLMETLLNYSQLYHWNVPCVFGKTHIGAGIWEEQRPLYNERQESIFKNVCVRYMTVGRGRWKECPRVIHLDLEKMVKIMRRIQDEILHWLRTKINMYWQKVAIFYLI